MGFLFEFFLFAGLAPSVWTVLISTMIVLVCVPFMILWYARRQCNDAAGQLKPGGNAPKKFRKMKMVCNTTCGQRGVATYVPVWL